MNGEKSLPSVELTPEDWKDIQKSKEFLEKGEGESALSILKKLQSKHPDNRAILTLLAMAYTKANRYSEAEELYQKLIEKFPTETIYQIRLATLYIQLERDRDALSLLEKAKELEPESKEVNRSLGILYFRQRDYQKAIECFKKSGEEKLINAIIPKLEAQRQVGRENPTTESFPALPELKTPSEYYRPKKEKKSQETAPAATAAPPAELSETTESGEPFPSTDTLPETAADPTPPHTAEAPPQDTDGESTRERPEKSERDETSAAPNVESLPQTDGETQPTETERIPGLHLDESSDLQAREGTDSPSVRSTQEQPSPFDVQEGTDSPSVRSTQEQPSPFDVDTDPFIPREEEEPEGPTPPPTLKTIPQQPAVTAESSEQASTTPAGRGMGLPPGEDTSAPAELPPAERTTGPEIPPQSDLVPPPKPLQGELATDLTTEEELPPADGGELGLPVFIQPSEGKAPQYLGEDGELPFSTEWPFGDFFLAPPPRERGALLQFIDNFEAWDDSEFVFFENKLFVNVRERVFVRLKDLVFLSGRPSMHIEYKRYQNKRVGQIFGPLENPMVCIQGQAKLILSAPPDTWRIKLRVTPDEPLFFKEGFTLAFSSSVQWENGRIPSKLKEELEIAIDQFFGNGELIVESDGQIWTVPIRDGERVKVPPDRLVGWNGPLIPTLVHPDLHFDSRELPKYLIEFKGEGNLFLLFK